MARGRCQPRRCITVPLFQPIRPAGNHPYAPEVDRSTAQFRKAVRQLRRLQRLPGRLQKLTDDTTLHPDWPQLTTDWQVIRTTIFAGQPFQQWLETFPGRRSVLETFYPDLAFLDQACQLALFHVKHLESEEARRLRTAQRYERLYDQKWASYAGAVRKIRPACHQSLPHNVVVDRADI